MKKGKGVTSYNIWGVIFIIPFFLVFIVCTLVPQFLTFYNSFFENFRDGLTQIGPRFVGFENYIALFKPDSKGDVLFWKYLINTLILWIVGAVPQVAIALLLAVFFTSERLKIKGQGFFKTVMYMPNLIMASAFSMLFYTLFSNVGPVNQILFALFGDGATVDFFSKTVTVRALIGLMNFMMWFGNTTLVLMSGIMGIDSSLFEAASIDGANSVKVFFKITLPLLKPILIYTVITALIGGIQMFDVPQILTSGTGAPDMTSRTLVMVLNSYLGSSKNYGMSGALSVLLFIISGALSLVVFKFMVKGDEKK